ncbi:MAG: BPL-N domain-containing protein [Alphaproteobacteria bacterium]|nr:MAG: hypothetical protein B6I23_02885 [Rickettsiaceae bacterium 4572_127]
METVIYYDGYSSGIVQLTTFLKELGLSSELKNSVELIKAIEYKKPDIIFLPGATGIEYGQTLLPHKVILQNYIKEGGIVCGTCGGFYLAGENITFQDYQTKGLGLYSGNAIGDLPKLVDGKKFKEEGAGQFIPVKLKGFEDKNVSAWYHGGTTYSAVEQDVEILGWYNKTKEPCAIKQHMGKGFFFGTGFHSEIRKYHEPNNGGYIKGSKEILIEFMKTHLNLK